MQKKLRFYFNGKCVFVLFLLSSFVSTWAQKVTIPIATNSNMMLLETDSDNRLRTVYFGKLLDNASEYPSVSGAYNFKDDNAGIYNATYTPAGTWNFSEPAIQVKHADGNPSLELKYVSHKTEKVDANSSITSIVLKDPVYPFEVTLFYKIWAKENVIEQWTEIKHNEKKAVLLQKFASANLYFTNKDFYLTSFQGQYVKEMQPIESKLLQGIRTVDSKLGQERCYFKILILFFLLGNQLQKLRVQLCLGNWLGAVISN